MSTTTMKKKLFVDVTAHSSLPVLLLSVPVLVLVLVVTTSAALVVLTLLLLVRNAFVRDAVPVSVVLSLAVLVKAVWDAVAAATTIVTLSVVALAVLCSTCIDHI